MTSILPWEGESLSNQTILCFIIYAQIPAIYIPWSPLIFDPHLYDPVAEAQAFDDEWQQKVSDFQPAARLSRLEAPRARAAHRAAITGPEHTHRFTYLNMIFYKLSACDVWRTR